MTTTTTNELAAALEKSIGSVTRGWTEAKRHADRQQRVSQRALADLRRARRPPKLTIKAAAWQVMERAYRKASAGDTLTANARQIMYAARPLVLELTGGECWKNSATFTQQLLPGFIEAYPGRTAGWNVAYDARGRLVEPHTGDRTDLGTLEVRSYVRAWVGKVPPKLDITLRHACPTRGPANRYRFALFIEKEGFYPLLEAAGIANRFDLAIMSTKGMSVTAARELVDQLSAYGVTLLVAHDFDKAGFAILHTLQQSSRRYVFRGRPNVIDLGLRLADALALGLQSEPVEYDSKVDPRRNLAACGATREEQDFLVRAGGYRGWVGERIELNAMDSAQFVTWLEEKLLGAGVEKVVPDADALAAAYRRAWRLGAVQEVIDRLEADGADADDIPVPAGLAEVIRTQIAGTEQSWDAAIWMAAQAARQTQGEADHA